MDPDTGNDKECHTVIASSAPKGSAESNSSQSKEILILKQSADQGDMMRANIAESSSGLKGSAVVPNGLAVCEEVSKGNRFCSPKVDRLHWDLNILMDEWEQPSENATMDKTFKDGFSDGSQVEKLNIDVCGKKRGSEDYHDTEKYLPLDNKGTLLEHTNLRAEDFESHSTNNITFIEELSIGNLGRNSTEKSSSTERKREINLDASTSDSSFSKLHNASNLLISNGLTNTALDGGLIMMQTGESSAKVSKYVNAALNDEHCLDSLDASFQAKHGFESVYKREDHKDPIKSCELPDNSASNVISVGSFKSKPAEACYCNSSSTCKDLSSTKCSMGEVQNAYTTEPKERNGKVSAGEMDYTNSPTQLEGKEITSKSADRDAFNQVGEQMTVVKYLPRSCNEGSQINYPASQFVNIGSTHGSWHNSDISQDDRAQMIDPENMVGVDTGYDSPIEDGELRESISFSCEGENECGECESNDRDGVYSDTADNPASEIVECCSEGSHSMYKRISSHAGGSKVDFGNAGSSKSFLRRHFNKVNNDNIVSDGREGLDMQSSRVQWSADTSDKLGAFEFRGSYMEEVGSKTKTEKLQPHIERPYLDARNVKDAMLMQQSRRCNRFGTFYNRPAREVIPDKFNGGSASSYNTNDRSGGHGQSDWRKSRNRYPSSYNTSERHDYKSRSSAYSADKFRRVDSRDNQQDLKFSSKGVHRPIFSRRSSVERGNLYDIHERMPPGIGGYRSSGGGGSFSHSFGRGIRDEFHESVPEDTDLRPLHMPQYVSRREMRDFPTSRDSQISLLRRTSRSRSRTRSPRSSHTQRTQNFSTRLNSGSPDLRSDSRIDRKRIPFHKAGRDEGSPPRGYCSPGRSSRWAEKKSFVGRQLRHSRSPERVIRQCRVDPVGPSGRFKSDYYGRPTMRPGRFEQGHYNEKIQDDRSEMIRGTRNSDSGGSVKRFLHDAGNGFEAGNSNSEEVAQSTDCRNIQRNAREDNTIL